MDSVTAGDDDLLYGINPVLLSLRNHSRDRYEALFVQQRSESSNRKRDNDMAVEEIHRLAMTYGLRVYTVPKGELNNLTDNRPHQGVVLRAAAMQFSDMTTMPAVTEGVWLALDEVADPQNLGSLLRSAHFLQCAGVLVCKRNSARLSPVVSKASAGALELMTVHGVASMPRFLKGAKERGWSIWGLGMDGSELGGKHGKGVIVVLGNEGRGLRHVVRDTCDEIVGIGGGADGIDSLNVGVAGGIALYQILGGHRISS